MTRIPRRRHSYRRRPAERAAGPFLLGLLIGMVITLGVALAAPDIQPRVVAVNAGVVFASILGMLALGDRFARFLWQRNRLAKIALDRYEMQTEKINILADRLENRELMLKQQALTIKDLRETNTNQKSYIDRLENRNAS